MTLQETPWVHLSRRLGETAKSLLSWKRGVRCRQLKTVLEGETHTGKSQQVRDEGFDSAGIR